MQSESTAVQRGSVTPAVVIVERPQVRFGSSALFVVLISVNSVEIRHQPTARRLVRTVAALLISVTLIATESIWLHGTNLNVYNFVFLKNLSSQICKCLRGSRLCLALNNMDSINLSVKYAWFIWSGGEDFNMRHMFSIDSWSLNR